MAASPTEEDVRTWHRHFAVAANNHAWTLSEQRELTDPQRTELLLAAHAAAYHWRQIGTESHRAMADLLLGRAYALLGHGELAMDFATAAFEAISGRASEPWEVALAHAVLADAAAAAGYTELHAEHHSQAEELGAALTDPQDREIFLATFDRIARPGSPSSTGREQD